MAQRGYSALTELGLGALTFNSALAIYNSWGDAGSVAFVLAAGAALGLLFLCLRELERAGDAKIKAAVAVWALTTLLTTMFASGLVPTAVPLAVGALVFLCLRDVDRVRAGEGGGGGVDMDAQYCALVKVGFAVLTCNLALVDDNDAPRDDPSPAAFVLVLVSYTVLVILTGLFVRAVARAHAGEHGQR